MTKIVYVDMDGVLVDFESGINALPLSEKEKYIGQYDNAPNIFGLMQPIPGAINAFNTLTQYYDVYILSTAPYDNPSAWADKLLWVKHYLGASAYKRLILSHNKHLNMGDYLIDDRTANGADRFKGELILYGSDKFPTWGHITEYLYTKNNG